MNRKFASLAGRLGHLRHRDGPRAGLLSTTASAADSDFVKREEDRVEMVLVDDRDDDDTNDDTDTAAGQHRQQRDGEQQRRHEQPLHRGQSRP